MNYAKFSKISGASKTTIQNWVKKGHLLSRAKENNNSGGEYLVDGGLLFDDEDEAAGWVKENTRYFQVVLPRGETLKAVGAKEISPASGFSYVDIDS